MTYHKDNNNKVILKTRRQARMFAITIGGAVFVSGVIGKLVEKFF